jgi:hypothetical protein
MLLAGGAVLVIGVLGGGFAVSQDHKATAEPLRGVTSSASASAVTSTSPTAASGTASATATPIPPDGVAVVASGTELKVSWHDPEGNPQHFPVVITLGADHLPKPVAGGSPQVLTGLDPAKPYCVAVGYVYSMDGRTAYSTPECVRGGQASAPKR